MIVYVCVLTIENVQFSKARNRSLFRDGKRLKNLRMVCWCHKKALFKPEETYNTEIVEIMSLASESIVN